MLASFYRGGSRFFSRTDTVVIIISITGGGARSFSLLPFFPRAVSRAVFSSF